MHVLLHAGFTQSALSTTPAGSTAFCNLGPVPPRGTYCMLCIDMLFIICTCIKHTHLCSSCILYCTYVTRSAKTRHNGAFQILYYCIILIYLAKHILWPSFNLVCQQLLELQSYKVATTERSICTTSSWKINYRCLQ